MDNEFDNIDPALIHHRIQAAQSIPANTVSETFQFDTVRLVSILYNRQVSDDESTLPPELSSISGPNIFLNSPNNRLKPRSILIHSTADNRFACDNTVDAESWMHRVRLAQNCFEQNLIAVSVSVNETISSSSPNSPNSGRIFIQFRSNRPIAAAEELCFWPSFELSLQLNIPFLVPANIISGSCFLCTKCGKFFSQPNPLKIHMKFACFDAFQKLNNGSLEWNNWNQSLALNGFWSSMNVINQEAFNTRHHQQSSPSSLVKEADSKFAINLDKISRKTFCNEVGKRLHHCNYCGKVYTRKYGLKIHIRTHTGLKPLSCRFCARSFSDPSNLNKHVRLHTQSKQ